MSALLCAVDVGTGSARAGILDAGGRLLGRHAYPIAMRRPATLLAEHSSEDIWSAVCRAVAGAVVESGADPEDVGAIAFDATCSLVMRDAAGHPLPVSAGAEPGFDTLSWIDHRSLAEAAECTATGDAFLANVGGTMSPEMQTPKLMWLKRRRPEIWERVGHLFDLADFLSWRACGSTARSRCTLSAKWPFDEASGGWQEGFLARAGLSDLVARGGLPAAAVAPGTDLGPLDPPAARELGLPATTRVAAGMVDAFAGALAVLGPSALAGRTGDAALVAGTSNCLMTMTDRPLAINGYWGPYRDPVLPGLWITEGGQSATGALLDYMVRIHACGGEPTAELHARILARIGELRDREGMAFAAGLHVVPDFHGSRSPLADPFARGVVSGLALDASFDGLCRLYWRSCVAIALGVRQIVDGFDAAGRRPERLLMAGGHARNPLLSELYADATGLPVAWQACDSMLLGTAMAASVAAGIQPDLATACRAMAQPLETRPADRAAGHFYDRDYRILVEMKRQRAVIERLQQGA